MRFFVRLFVKMYSETYFLNSENRNRHLISFLPSKTKLISVKGAHSKGFSWLIKQISSIRAKLPFHFNTCNMVFNSYSNDQKRLLSRSLIVKLINAVWCLNRPDISHSFLECPLKEHSKEIIAIVM